MAQDYAALAAELGGKPQIAESRRFSPIQPEESKEQYIDRAIDEFGGLSLPGPSVVGQVSPVIPALAAGAKKVAEKTRDVGSSLVLSYVKPRFSELQRRAGIEGSTPTNVARRIARFMVDNRLTTAEKAAALAKASGQQVDDAVAKAETAAPQLSLDTAERIPRYLNAVLRRIEKQMLPGKDRVAVQNVGKEVVEDSPLSRSTFTPRPAETLEAGLARGTQEAMTIAKNAGKSAPRGPGGSQFTDAGGAFPKSARPRELRTDVKPSQGVEIVRTKSFYDPTSTGGQIAGGKAIERAVRDAVKQAVPETRAPLAIQGRAMDAQRLLERGEHLGQNRDTLGGFAQTMALSGNIRGLLAQLLKESQLRFGAGGAPRIAAGLDRAGQGIAKSQINPDVVQSLLAQLMASHGQE